MKYIMFLIHPIFQSSAIIVALYTLFLGINRFMFLHLKKRTKFNWKLHTRLGLISLSLMFIGSLGGFIVVFKNWGGYLITGAHGFVGLLLIFLIVVGLVTGLYMDRNKKKRMFLPLLHGVNNLILTFLSLFQIYSGIEVYKIFVLGL